MKLGASLPGFIASGILVNAALPMLGQWWKFFPPLAADNFKISCPSQNFLLPQGFMNFCSISWRAMTGQMLPKDKKGAANDAAPFSGVIMF